MPHADVTLDPRFEVKVGSINPVADGVIELVLVDPQGGLLPAWEPGAHLDLHLPNGLVRQYSLTSDVTDRGGYRVAVLREANGRGGSDYIHDRLQVGDTLTCAGPRNNFSLESAKSYQFVAGGIGITPLLQMIESAERSHIPWKLFYFGRTRGSMAWADELQEQYPNRVRIRPDEIFGPPDLATELGEPEEGELTYACGPPGLLDALSSHLGEAAREVLHIERFTPADPEALEADGQPFTVTLDRSGIELEIPADKSILQVMEERGVPVIASCREGTCGTCETAIIAGEAEHRDSILSEDEKAENESMMICCSRSKGDGLVIDA